MLASTIEGLAGTHGVHHLRNLLPGSVVDSDLDLQALASRLVLYSGFECADPLEARQLQHLNPVIECAPLRFANRADAAIVLEGSGEVPGLAIEFRITRFEVHTVDSKRLRVILD